MPACRWTGSARTCSPRRRTRWTAGHWTGWPGMPGNSRRARRARAVAATGAGAEAERVARQALAEGERLGDPIAQGSAFSALYVISDYTGGQVYLDRALAVLGHLPETTGLRIRMLANGASNLCAIGHGGAAEPRIREALILAEQTGSWRLPWVRAHAADVYLDAGRWDDALTMLEPTAGMFRLFERLIRLGG